MSQTQGSPSNNTERVLAELQGDLARLEQQRQQMRARTRQLVTAIAAVAVVLGIIVAMMVDAENQGLGLFVVVLGVIASVILIVRQQGQWKQQVYQQVMPVICASHEQLQYRRQVGDGAAFIRPYEKLSLFGYSNSRRIEHYLHGSHRGTNFEVVSAHLSRKSGGKNSSSSTVFSGLLFRIQMPIDLPTRIVIRPKGIFVSRIKDMVNVETGNAEFDERFLVSHESADAEGAARVQSVLTPAMQQTLLQISAEEGGLVNNRAAIAAGLIYDSLYLTLTRATVGEAGKIKFERPREFLDLKLFLRAESNLEKAVADMVHDVEIVYRIIDRLQQSEAEPATEDAALWR